MSQPGVSRKLAAILAMDVVGYSRLMGADEERHASEAPFQWRRTFLSQDEFDRMTAGLAMAGIHPGDVAARTGGAAPKPADLQ
ncbi:MAG: hypothetical protein AB7O56_01995 [Bauldia sp.]